VREFCQRKVGAIPVVEGGRLVGIVTQTDMMRAFLAVLERE
jgi:CBS domain-containing protein